METITLLPGMGRSGENDASTEIEFAFTDGSETNISEEFTESEDVFHPIGIASKNISLVEGWPRSNVIVLLPGSESI